ncbi:MAG: LysR family transcriptional regulator [Gammaproteobacteria bacterium]
MKTLDWNDLRYFLELARQGKLVQAAARLHVDHTTVSRRISALESQLEVRLFDRSPRGYQLTDAGQRLLPLAESMESTSNRVTQEIAGKDSRLTGVVRIATPEALGTQVIARHIPAFREQHPDIEIELVAATRGASLSKREADIAIRLSRPDSGRLVAWKLCDYRIRLVGSEDHLAQHGPVESLEDLQSLGFVSYIDDMLEMPELRYLESVVKKPRIVFRSNNVIAQYNAILGGAGLGMVHCFMSALAQDRLKPVLPEQISVTRSYWLLVHEDLRNVARIDAVCRFVTGLLRENDDLMMGA